VILVHLLLVVAWGCWGVSLFLPAFANPDSGIVMSGMQCLRMAIMMPEAFPLYGVANFLVISTPFLIKPLHRRCPGWFAGLGALWCGAAIAFTMFTIEKPMIGCMAWMFALFLTAVWLLLCWLARRKPA
jgi:hypothetical protein